MSSNDEVRDGMVRRTLADRKAKPSVETNMDPLGGQLSVFITCEKNICLCTCITSKRVELEGPGCSRFKAQ